VELRSLGVKLAAHCDSPATVGTRAHVVVGGIPAGLPESVTVPVGEVWTDPEVSSVTVTVHVVGVPTSTGFGTQVTAVLVERTTVSVNSEE
jgi:hypothetical protein